MFYRGILSRGLRYKFTTAYVFDLARALGALARQHDRPVNLRTRFWVTVTRPGDTPLGEIFPGEYILSLDDARYSMNTGARQVVLARQTFVQAHVFLT